MRQAVVVIHGIGEQKPMETIRNFVDAVIEDSPDPNKPKFWNKPDYISELFEMRRYTVENTETRPSTDFYEYYWSHLMSDTNLFQVIRWIWKLLFTWPSKLTPKVWPIWGMSWASIIVFVYFLFKGGISIEVFINLQWDTSKNLIISISALIFLFVLNRLALFYIGDAARYLSLYSDNVDVRQEIRSHGIQFLRKLHESEKYDRVIMVGHSLGSVIAYDILKHLWVEYNEKHGSPLDNNQPVLNEFEERYFTTDKDNKPNCRWILKYQEVQKRLWFEQRKLGNPWLVSDFITLGSPLGHAQFLLAKSKKDLEARQKECELPKCPPVFEGKKISFPGELYETQNQKRRLKTLHHAALFGPTRWTNLYFPGDFIGGRLNGVFGAGIKDLKVSSRSKLGSYLPTSHTKYWSKPWKCTDSKYYALEVLKKELNLELIFWNR